MSEQLDTSQLTDLLMAIDDFDDSSAYWKSIMAKLRALLSADMCAIVLRFPEVTDRGVIYYDGCDPMWVHNYQCSLYRTDASIEKKNLFTNTDLNDIPHDSELYKTLIEPIGIHHAIIGNGHTLHRHFFRLFVGNKDKAQHFSKTDRCYINIVLDKLLSKFLVENHNRYASFITAASIETLDNMPLPVIIIGDDFKIYYENNRASTLLDQGKDFSRNNGVFSRSDNSINIELHNKLSEVIHDNTYFRSGVSKVFKIDGYQITVKPIWHPKADAFTKCMSLYIIDDHNLPLPKEELLTELYNLTPTESRVAVLLASGKHLDAIGDTLLITKNTVRAHLRSMFVKCDVRRQACLVQKILSSAAMTY